jgi:Putative addiction module component
MSPPLALNAMTIEEKLEVMEQLWTDLSRHENAIAVHEWQQQILDERERLIADGQTGFIDWDEAKEDIARETSSKLKSSNRPNAT